MKKHNGDSISPHSTTINLTKLWEKGFLQDYSNLDHWFLLNRQRLKDEVKQITWRERMLQLRGPRKRKVG